MRSRRESIGSHESMDKHSLAVSAAMGKTFKPGDLFVAVMGIMGSGKSTFISKLSEEDVEIGTTMDSCTQSVMIYTVKYFQKTIHLIDTPGFNENKRSDFEILNEITSWLNLSYHMQVKLSGVIYLHRITDPKMSGAAFLNVRTIYELIGKEHMGSVILATTHWDNCDSEDRISKAEWNETQLKEKYWRRMTDAGAKMRKHRNTEKTAMEILWEIIAPGATTNLKVQEEMNVDKAKLCDTSAGQVINEPLIEQQKKFERELKSIMKEQEEKAKKQDEHYQNLLKADQAETNRRLAENKQIQDEYVRSAESQMAEKVALINTLSENIARMDKCLSDDKEETRTLAERLDAAQHDVADYRQEIEKWQAQSQYNSSDNRTTFTTPDGSSVDMPMKVLATIGGMIVISQCCVM